MRLLIKLLLVLAASVAVVTLLGEGPGYVLVQVGGYTLETTAALAALALILVLAVGWEVWGMVAATWHLPAAFGQARERRHQRQSLEALEEGVLALERGEAQRARKLFARGARHAKAPAAFFMEAARAAHRLNLGVNAGHGLCYNTIKAFQGNDVIDEYSIGHSIVARAALVGMEKAVREMGELVGKV